MRQIEQVNVGMPIAPHDTRAMLDRSIRKTELHLTIEVRGSSDRKQLSRSHLLVSPSVNSTQL